MLSSNGILTGGGFETPAEALFLQKKLIVVPMLDQYEQQCNACALEQLGVPVLPCIDKYAIPVLQEWVQSTEPFINSTLNFKDPTPSILQK